MKNIWRKMRDCWLDFWEDDELDMDKKHLSQHDKRSLLYGGFMIGVATFGLFSIGIIAGNIWTNHQNQKDMEEAGLTMTFVQDNQSMSAKGVLRGLHFQKQYPQCKLVRAVRGTVFDVAVDLRSNSETYGKWYGVTLSAENKKQFLIPEGFAHGFLVLSDEAEFCYKVNDFWHPNDEGGMAWNDPEIGIEWPELKGEYKGSASAEGYTLEDGTALNLSDKDQKWLGLKDTFKF